MSTDATKKFWCANGRPGYDTLSGKAYTPRPTCGNHARPGHIYCERCRVAEGGAPL